LTDRWSIGPTKDKRFRRGALSAPVFDRLRLYIDSHQRAEQSLVFDYALLRAEHAQKKERDPRPARFPTGRFVSPTSGRSGAHGRAHTYSLGCRCPYCRTAASEARFWSRRAKGIQPAAPWLEEGYLADRSEAIDPIKYHWFTRYVFGRAVRAARLEWTPTFHDLRHGMVSWSYDAGASPAVVQRDAGHANVRTTQAYMHVVDRVVGDERLSAMKVMYDRVEAAGQPAVTPPTEWDANQQDVPSADAASTSGPALEQLSAIVLSNSALTTAEKAALLLESWLPRRPLPRPSPPRRRRCAWWTSPADDQLACSSRDR
jgi:hypothetical protein